jgi:hypothetical protein
LAYNIYLHKQMVY